MRLAIFGTPHLTDKSGRIIYFEGRKELATLAFLSRQEGLVASREYLAELLWSGSGRDKALASLRQVVRKLHRLEEVAGAGFLSVSKATITLDPARFTTDLDVIMRCLGNAASHSIARAARLLAPGFMEGLAYADPEFSRWRRSEQERVREALLNRATVQLSRLPGPAHASFALLARFMLKVDRTYEWGHQCLIRHYLATDRPELAEKQFEECEAVLRRTPGLPPALAVGDLRSGSAPFLGEYAKRFRPPPVGTAGSFPRIYIESQQRPRLAGQSVGIVSEYVEQLGLSRDLAVRMAPEPRTGQERGPRIIGISEGDGGEFLLRLSANEERHCLSVELLSRHSSASLHFDLVDYGRAHAREDIAWRVGKSISAMREKIQQYYRSRPRLSGSPYARFSSVYELIKKLDRRSSERALEILSDIEGQEDAHLNLVYAFKASVQLQRRLFMQASVEAEAQARQARAWTEEAVDLDPWHGLSQRYLGFAACNLGDHDRGKQHMLIAQSLNPFDPLQSIATAETCAFVGDVDEAIAYSDRAQKYIRDVPRYFYGYMANIHFAAGNYSDAAEMARLAPGESMDYRATRIAALWNLGRQNEARSEFRDCMLYLARQPGTAIDIDAANVSRWLGELNPFASPRTLAAYRSGIARAAGSA